MIADIKTSADALVDHSEDQIADSAKRRKRRVRVDRSQEKFPRWIRVLLWLGMPIALWTGAYLIGRALI